MSLNSVSHQEMSEIIKEALILKVTPLFEDLKGIEAAEVVRDYFLNNTIHPHAVFTFGQNIINRKQSDDTNLFAKELTETMAALVADNMILACGKSKNPLPFIEVLKLFCDEKHYESSARISFTLTGSAEKKFLRLMSGLGEKKTMGTGLSEFIGGYSFADSSFINRGCSETDFIYRNSLKNKVDITPYLNGMCERHIEQIRLASEAGLTEEQIKVIANPNFDAQQMFQVRLACQLGLNMEQVKIIADPELDWLQISELHQSFKVGLNMEQVRDIIRFGFNGVQIHELNLAFQSKLPEEQFNSLIDSEFDQERMKELRLKFEAKLSEDANSHFYEPQM